MDLMITLHNVLVFKVVYLKGRVIERDTDSVRASERAQSLQLQVHFQMRLDQAKRDPGASSRSLA